MTMAVDSETSSLLFDRARRVMPGGVNSPVRAGRTVGVDPRFVRRAEGAYLYDADGRRYVDLVGSWGTAIVGHAHPRVVEAVQQATCDGLSFGACHAAEVELAEVIVGAFPSIDMVRFVNSGTEATMSAIRLARAASGRDLIIKFIGGYHGHMDSLLVSAGSGAATLGVPDSAGVPSAFARTTRLARYNSLSDVDRIMSECGQDVAAIIVEPIAGNMGMVEPEAGFLVGLRTVCDRHGAILIFDEVMTGFRVAWGGVQNLCGVTPDITCLGKVIGGGMPVAAYGASEKLMSLVSPCGPMYQAGTLSGNPLGMAAGMATLRSCRESGFYESLHEKSTSLTSRWQDAARDSGVPIQVSARGGMFGLFFSDSPVQSFDEAKACDHARYAKFYREMLDRGVWLPPSGYEAMFLSSAHHAAALDHVVDAAAESFKLLV